jgi:hypothetical protein
MSAIKGGCLCGAVSYEVTGEPMFVGHCACANCQKMTGTGHNSIAAYPDPQFSLHGQVKDYVGLGDSGMATTQSFCPTCGSRLYSRASMMPGVTMVTLGTLDPAADLTPSMMIYGKSRRAWDHVDPSMPVFEAMPAPPG